MRTFKYRTKGWAMTTMKINKLRQIKEWTRNKRFSIYGRKAQKFTRKFSEVRSSKDFTSQEYFARGYKRETAEALKKGKDFNKKFSLSGILRKFLSASQYFCFSTLKTKKFFFLVRKVFSSSTAADKKNNFKFVRKVLKQT